MAIIHILLVTLLSSCSFAYINSWDGRAFFQCPNSQYLSHISSVHNNHKEDRLWDFGCSGSGANSHCYWSGYANEWDDMLAFVCPGNSVITGIDSYHDNGKEDRRFKFRCCGIPGKVPFDCSVTPFANTWDGKLTLGLHHRQVLKGAFSDHRNDKEDRRWKFYVCKI